MKKSLVIISAAVLSIVTATVVLASSVPAESEGYIECTLPNIPSGTITLDQFEIIYNVIPDSFKEQMVSSFQEITDAALTKSQFYYNGVLVKHPNETTWEFSSQGCSIKVCNVSMQALKEIFHAD